jgi:hypothetical protein
MIAYSRRGAGIGALGSRRAVYGDNAGSQAYSAARPPIRFAGAPLFVGRPQQRAYRLFAAVLCIAAGARRGGW